MYCIYNSTVYNNANDGSPLGWPFEKNYGYFCDERDNHLFLLSSSPIRILSIIGAYLAFVLWIGPNIMKDRKPLEIKNLIRFYNAAMILCNIVLNLWPAYLHNYGRDFFNCKGTKIDFEQMDTITFVTELYFLSRFADFFDTVFFVLRKKQEHVSFLHVFHHTYVPTLIYFMSRFYAIRNYAMFFPMINNSMHIIMYTYYLLATFPSLKPYLWWKKYLTTMQMLQFVIVGMHNTYAFVYVSTVCGELFIAPFVVSIATAIIFLILFKGFYNKTYVQKAVPESQSQKPITQEPMKQHVE